MKKLACLLILIALAVPVFCAVNGNRVVIRLVESDIESTSAAVDNLVNADILFAMERLLREDDSPEMKSLLAKVVWKNNQLLEKINLPGEIRVVTVKPGEEKAVIEMAKAEGWEVKVPSVWEKILKEERRVLTGRTYYVNNDGNDDADGLTPATAWKTLGKVNSAELGFGDKVLFRCGDVFRGYIDVMSGCEGHPIYYGSYGRGRKPVIEPSFDASSESDWTPAGDKLWKCVRKSANELGNIIFNHGRKGCAYKEDRLDQLQGRDLHFTWVRDENAVYMVSETNPAGRFSSIELAEKQHIIYEEGAHDVCYDGLWLRYGSAHGVGGSGVKRITVRNCDISWIGGSTLYIDNTGSSVRYGNGIEFWSAAEDVLVENCRVWECYDAGITHQSNMADMVQKNITIRGNRIWNCEYSYEYWQQGDGARTENVVFENNVCLDAGGGWGHVRRWNPNAGHLMFYDNTAKVDGFIIRNNVFKRTENCGIRLFNAWYPSITMSGNRWVIPANQICRYHGRPTSGLIYKYPDHLDQTRNDDETEIQSQTVEKPETFGSGSREAARFSGRFGF